MMATLVLSNPHELVLPKHLGARPRADRSREAGVTAFARLAAGDREALADLYDLYADELFGFALWLSGSSVDAADVVQEVFVRLLERRGRLDEVRKPRPYLLRVTRSVSIDRHRRLRRHRAAERLDQDLLVAEAGDPDRRLDAARLGRWLQRLPVKQRSVLYLRFFAELGYAEIGRVLGIPTFTAASRCRLATRRLRRWLQEDERE